MEFDAKKTKEEIIKFIKEYYKKYNLKGAVLGISGGKDSAVVAALMVEALGKDNVVGLTLPCHSKTQDKEDAELISNHYGFKLYNFDLTKVFDTFKGELKDLLDYKKENLKDSDINLKPRLRMATVYYFAALLSSLNGKPYLVAGTSNKSELFVGYFTKGGDSVHDIAPIADLTKDEVILLGEELNVPDKVLHKVPSDGLSTLTDEDKLGVTYKDIELYMKDPNLVNKETRDTIKNLHDKNQHKFVIPKYIKGE